MGTLTEKYEMEAAAKDRLDEARGAVDLLEGKIGVRESELRRFAGTEPRRSPDRALARVAVLQGAAEERLRGELRAYLPELLVQAEDVPAPLPASLVAAWVAARDPGVFDALRDEIPHAAADPGFGPLSSLDDEAIEKAVAERTAELEELRGELGQAKAELEQAEADLDAARNRDL